MRALNVNDEWYPPTKSVFFPLPYCKKKYYKILACEKMEGSSTHLTRATKQLSSYWRWCRFVSWRERFVVWKVVWRMVIVRCDTLSLL